MTGGHTAPGMAFVLCCLYVPPLSPHDREYAVAVTLSPRELPDLLPPSLLGRLRCGTPAVGV